MTDHCHLLPWVLNSSSEQASSIIKFLERPSVFICYSCIIKKNWITMSSSFSLAWSIIIVVFNLRPLCLRIKIHFLFLSSCHPTWMLLFKMQYRAEMLTYEWAGLTCFRLKMLVHWCIQCIQKCCLVSLCECHGLWSEWYEDEHCLCAMHLFCSRKKKVTFAFPSYGRFNLWETLTKNMFVFGHCVVSWCSL